MKDKTITKATLCFSLILLAVWLFLGTESSVAWFRDDDTLVNALHFGDIDIAMYHKVSGKYETADNSTEIFDNSALYEPGVTQVAYLKIENRGTVPFSYDLSVMPDMASTVVGIGVLGNRIDLADYIRFGLIVDGTEEAVMKKTASRESAIESAVCPLGQYSQSGGILAQGEEAYAAIILYFPEDVGNTANYRGEKAPEITLGISAIANQLND